MQIISIELLNDNALSLLKELEVLNVLRLVKTEEAPKPPKRDWVGRLSDETADKTLAYVRNVREIIVQFRLFLLPLFFTLIQSKYQQLSFIKAKTKNKIIYPKLHTYFAHVPKKSRQEWEERISNSFRQ